MRMRRRYRFIFASGLRQSWAPFGGLAAQLSYIAVLSMASTETSSVSISYHDELSLHSSPIRIGSARY